MTDLTHAAFRKLVKGYSLDVLFISEMVNVRYLRSCNPHNDPYLIRFEGEPPIIIQLVGKEESDFEAALEKISMLGNLSGINLNLGCTKGRFQKYGWGAALLKFPDKIKIILEVIKRSTRHHLSVKMRIPHSKEGFLELIRLFESFNLNFVAIHPRFPEDGFRKKARWEWIRLAVRSTSIPVIGNGDIFSPEDAERMLSETEAAGIMVGRAALIRPWIFRDIKSHFEGKPLPDPPLPQEPIVEMAEAIKRYLPQKWWEKRMDAFLYWYLQNFDHALYFLRKTRKAKGIDQKAEIACKLVENQEFRRYPVTPFLSPC